MNDKDKQKPKLELAEDGEIDFEELSLNISYSEIRDLAEQYGIPPAVYSHAHGRLAMLKIIMHAVKRSREANDNSSTKYLVEFDKGAKDIPPTSFAELGEKVRASAEAIQESFNKEQQLKQDPTFLETKALENAALSNGQNLPENLKPKRGKKTGNAWDVLESMIGIYDGPTDWSTQHDHYIYGTPKKEETEL
jgi:hypothetical protein